MRILLIYPPFTVHREDITLPCKPTLLGLGYVASVLEEAGFEVSILDCLPFTNYKSRLDANYVRHGFTDEQIKGKIINFHPDIVGVSCMYTPYYKDALNIAGLVKKINPKIFVVFGGSHVTTFPDQVMKNANIDCAVIGEGEMSMLEVAGSLLRNKSLVGVKGIIHREGDAVVKEAPRNFIDDLDSIPFPARHLFDIDAINQDNKGNKFLMRKPVAQMLTSRGCPMGCYYCSVKLVWGREWRKRSAKNAVDEIEFLKNKYGYQEFHFCDDNSSVSKSRMHEICDEIIKRKLDIKWTTPTGIAYWTLDEELLRKMKKSGCYRLTFGIESGDPETLMIIGKKQDLNKAQGIIKYANKLGMWTAATFIIGFPHETGKDVEKTLKVSRSLGLDLAIYYLLVPQPGTQVYKIFRQEGLLDLDSYLDPSTNEILPLAKIYFGGVATRNLTRLELQRYLSKAYGSFLRDKVISPKTYINVIHKIKTAEDLKYVLNLGMVVARKIPDIGIGIFKNLFSFIFKKGSMDSVKFKLR